MSNIRKSHIISPEKLISSGIIKIPNPQISSRSMMSYLKYSSDMEAPKNPSIHNPSRTTLKRFINDFTDAVQATNDSETPVTGRHREEKEKQKTAIKKIFEMQVHIASLAEESPMKSKSPRKESKTPLKKDHHQYRIRESFTNNKSASKRMSKTLVRTITGSKVFQTMFSFEELSSAGGQLSNLRKRLTLRDPTSTTEPSIRTIPGHQAQPQTDQPEQPDQASAPEPKQGRLLDRIMLMMKTKEKLVSNRTGPAGNSQEKVSEYKLAAQDYAKKSQQLKILSNKKK